jgi:hypothetical protein
MNKFLCSFNVYSLQIGSSMGFFIPPLLVPDNGNIEEIERGLTYVFYGCAIASTVVFVLQLFSNLYKFYDLVSFICFFHSFAVCSANSSKLRPSNSSK